MADVHSGTGAGMLEFLTWAKAKGEIHEARANNFLSAATAVLDIDDDPEGTVADVRLLDVDHLLARFETLNRTRYSSGSMTTYKSRFRQAVEAYRQFLDGGTGWRSKAPSSGTSLVRAGTAGPRKILPKRLPKIPELGSGPSSPAPTASPPPTERMIEYSLPLRPDLIVKLTLPVGLTSDDAERLAAFVKSLAFASPVRVPVPAPVTPGSLPFVVPTGSSAHASAAQPIHDEPVPAPVARPTPPQHIRGGPQSNQGYSLIGGAPRREDDIPPQERLPGAGQTRTEGTSRA